MEIIAFILLLAVVSCQTFLCNGQQQTTDATGVFSTGDGNYENMVNCGLSILTGGSSSLNQLEVTITHLHSEFFYDRLTITCDNNNHPQVYWFSGGVDGEKVTCETNKATLDFSSDQSITADGFTVTWKEVQPRMAFTKPSPNAVIAKGVAQTIEFSDEENNTLDLLLETPAGDTVILAAKATSPFTWIPPMHYLDGGYTIKVASTTSPERVAIVRTTLEDPDVCPEHDIHTPHFPDMKRGHFKVSFAPNPDNEHIIAEVTAFTQFLGGGAVMVSMYPPQKFLADHPADSTPESTRDPAVAARGLSIADLFAAPTTVQDVVSAYGSGRWPLWDGWNGWSATPIGRCFFRLHRFIDMTPDSNDPPQYNGQDAWGLYSEVDAVTGVETVRANGTVNLAYYGPNSFDDIAMVTSATHRFETAIKRLRDVNGNMHYMQSDLVAQYGQPYSGGECTFNLEVILSTLEAGVGITPDMTFNSNTLQVTYYEPPNESGRQRVILSTTAHKSSSAKAGVPKELRIDGAVHHCTDRCTEPGAVVISKVSFSDTPSLIECFESTSYTSLKAGLHYGLRTDGGRVRTVPAMGASVADATEFFLMVVSSSDPKFWTIVPHLIKAVHSDGHSITFLAPPGRVPTADLTPVNPASYGFKEHMVMFKVNTKLFMGKDNLGSWRWEISVRHIRRPAVDAGLDAEEEQTAEWYADYRGVMSGAPRAAVALLAIVAACLWLI